jgi:hypothetical protein
MQTVPKQSQSLEHLGDMYHDLSIFGFRTQQKPMYALNQKCKQPILTAYITHAIAKSQTAYDGDVSFVEMFCADAFYAMLARRLGATKCFGIDTNKNGWSGHNKEVAAVLGLDDIEFICDDVANLEKYGRFDIVANVGGLYHMSNPEEVLLASYRAASKFLIVQTVVSTAKNDPRYFETPAPGWTWGCRFSKEWLDRTIKKHRMLVVDQHFNELEGNSRPEDRGSCYYLIDVRQKRRLFFG